MDSTKYVVRSHYSFWDEPDRDYSKSFNSLWRAFDYYNEEDHMDTSHSFNGQSYVWALVLPHTG